MEVKGLNGKSYKVTGYREYSKTGIFKTTVERYDLSNGETYIVLPTKLLEQSIVKQKLNEAFTRFGVKVTK